MFAPENEHFRDEIWWGLFFPVQLTKVRLDSKLRLDFFFFPDDFNRVILSMKRGQEYTDYINASFIDVRTQHFHAFLFQIRAFAVVDKSF